MRERKEQKTENAYQQYKRKQKEKRKEKKRFFKEQETRMKGSKGVP